MARGPSPVPRDALRNLRPLSDKSSMIFARGNLGELMLHELREVPDLWLSLRVQT